MERIKLNKNCKRILRAIKNDTYGDGNASDYDDINLLQMEELINALIGFNDFSVAGLSPKGRAYLHSNPKLKNPSIWDDKKYWINTAISVLALIVAIIALFMK